ncbi:winged helix-turn-helix domain-containing protein [Anaerorudis cellulosivorans]|uniref:winged helix-turn-helix domain-containing protein n=1 Tax=Anaerorudis cellulosivorans TaxID=3397862 RepID=UPI00221E6F08|nr:winged helix-turn-helix domain-containing protein [Seramator thermalis]MCW1734960.1 winged helix-turn-helix domain-containing protein [Seramator thermalis]HON19427.1 winged helix-turn-helix domain-containing protein [Salinivirgaceae bacterium]
MEEIIGMNAGKVWTQLDIAGRQNVKDLKKATKLREKDLYAALGWLAREGKLCFEEEENGKELFVSLK